VETFYWRLVRNSRSRWKRSQLVRALFPFRLCRAYCSAIPPSFGDHRCSARSVTVNVWCRSRFEIIIPRPSASERNIDPLLRIRIAKHRVAFCLDKPGSKPARGEKPVNSNQKHMRGFFNIFNVFAFISQEYFTRVILDKRRADMGNIDPTGSRGEERIKV